jgi:hypothetical protein
VPAASAVIVAAVLVFPDFQGLRFVAIVFRHGVLLSEGRPNVEAGNYFNFRSTGLGCQSLFTQLQKI